MEKQTTTTPIKVQKETLGRDDLRAMAIGQEIEFALAEDKLESARSTCQAMKLKHMQFTTKFNIEANSIYVKRIK